MRLRKKFLPSCPFAVPFMADSSRRKIYEYLFFEGEKTVGEITKKIKLRQPTVSYHLKMMEKEGLLSSQRKGRQVYYKISLTCPEGGICFK
jgi:DNA-binding transcriptional ArsR family regulator